MNASLGGFANAPLSKVIVISCGLSSILIQASRASRNNISASILRVPIQWLAFEGPAELLFATFLLYFFRVLERQSGSSKFAGYLAVVSLLSWGFEAASKRLIPGLALPSGPYGVLFASFVQYFFIVPPMSKFSVLGCRLNDKAFMYLCGLQLCLSGGVRTMVAGASGLLAGIVYRSNIFGIRNVKVPKVLCRLASSTVGRLIDSSPPEAVVRPNAAPPRGAASA